MTHRFAVVIFAALVPLMALVSTGRDDTAPADAAPGRRLTYSTEIAAPVADVWRAFTTAEGLRAWMAPVVEIDLSIGGSMRSSYDPDATLGDPSTITSEVLAYDPERMLAMRASGFPEGFPWVDAAKSTWGLFYFEALDAERTRVTAVGNGYGDDEASQQMMAYFEVGNPQALAALAAWLERGERAYAR